MLWSICGYLLAPATPTGLVTACNRVARVGEDSSCQTGIPSSQGPTTLGSKVPCADCEPVGVKRSRQQARVRERTSVIIFQILIGEFQNH